MIQNKKSIPVYETGVVLVKTKDESVIHPYKHEKLHTKAMEHFGHSPVWKIHTDDVDATIEKLKKHPSVEWASKNYSRTVQTVTIDDPYFKDGSLWGLNKIGAPAAWYSGNLGDQKVYIGVIDEGIQYFHNDLCGQIWTNPDETDGDGIDNDGSGYADDMHGYDFFNKDATIFDGGGDNHGTHVSGTIGAKQDTVGVIGVCPNVTLISGKFLENYGYDSDAVLAIDYMIWLKIHKGLNIVALSNSWGGDGYDPILYDAIARARLANILMVCAAGNSANDSDINPMYPAAYDLDNIISVAAIQEDDQLAWFSNYGLKTVDLGAPGVRVLSTIPGSAGESNYAYYSGTSMATPHVSGACALYAAAHPGANYTEIKAAILASVVPNPYLSGKCVTGGTLNVSSFAATSPAPEVRGCIVPPFDTTPPTVPGNFRVTGVGINTVSFAWDASTDDLSGVKEYWVFVNDESNAWITSGLQITVGSLQAGVEYSFFIRAVDHWGNWSDPSPIVKATPIADTTKPTTPTNVTASGIDNDTILVTWTASTDDNGISKYNIYYRRIGDIAWIKEQQGYYSYFYDINGLLPGTEYEIFVTALDWSGNESDPSPVLTAMTTGENTDTEPPSVPSGLLTVDITFDSITLDWSPSTDNVGVVGYNVYIKKASDSIYTKLITPQTSYIFSSLSSDTIYDFYVTAYDAAGNVSGASVVVSASTNPLPPPVGDITVTLSGSDRILSWIITNAQNPLVELQRKVKPHSGYSTVLSGGIDFTSYVIPSKPRKAYYWRIKVSEGSQVVYSNEVLQ